MKKVFLLMILIAAIAIMSCSKGDVVQPVELAPTLDLQVSNSSVDYEGYVVLTWYSTNATTVSINGETMNSTSGSKAYSNLTSTTTYSALTTNVTKTASA